MKRNQLSAVANIRRKVTNGAPLSIDAIRETAETYAMQCGLSIDIELNQWQGAYQRAEIVFYDGLGDSHAIRCRYISDDVHLSDYGVKSEHDLPHGVGLPSYRIGNKQAWGCPIANGCRVLVSYSTVIGVYEPTANTLYLQPQAYQYSQTTSRHIGVFMERTGAEFVKFVNF